jgi:hypothetical protein
LSSCTTGAFSGRAKLHEVTLVIRTHVNLISSSYREWADLQQANCYENKECSEHALFTVISGVSCAFAGDESLNWREPNLELNIVNVTASVTDVMVTLS